MADLPTNQLRLVDLRIHFQDRSWPLSHAFPFADARWRVAFVLLEIYGLGLRIQWESLEARPDGLHTRSSTKELQLLGSIPRGDLAGLVHFDPWWVFKSPVFLMAQGTAGAPGVLAPDPAWIEAVKASNIAVRFEHEGHRYTVEDLVFDPGLRRIEEVRTRDRWSRPRTFRYGEIELLRLRRPAPHP